MKKLFVILLLTLSPLLIAGEVPEWRRNVTEAKALDDPAKRTEAMLALLSEALWPREVRLSGTSDAEHVHPDDNQPAPIVNFDARLNQKQSARPRNGGSTRSLENNAGYYFSVRGDPYIVLGPAALDPRSPAFTRLIAEHELFHAENHVGDPRPLIDRELETWSNMFVRYFDEIHPFKQRWGPMLRYYDDADAGEQQAAIERLMQYYNAPGTSEEERQAFREWLDRRKKDKSVSVMVPSLEELIDLRNAKR